MSEPPKVISSNLLYEGKILKLRVDELSLPQGGTTFREVVDHIGVVAIAALNDKGEVYLVRQYRHPLGEDLLELPAGGMESGESPLEAAQRELREEVGLQAENWTSLGSFFSSPGFANEKIYAFLATGLTSVPTDPDFDEDITVVKSSFTDLLHHLGQLTDAKTLATMLLILLKHPDLVHQKNAT